MVIHYCVFEGFEPSDDYYVCGTEETFFSWFSSNSEANALELLENHEKMFPMYW